MLRDRAGAAAVVGRSEGYWADDTDFTATTGFFVAKDIGPHCFPRDWPGVYTSSRALKLLLGKKGTLHATRVHVSHPPSPEEQAKVAGLNLEPLQSWQNAERVAAKTGMAVVKGWVVYELLRGDGSATDGEPEFVAQKYWFNRDAGGKTMDFTPRAPAGAEVASAGGAARSAEARPLLLAEVASVASTVKATKVLTAAHVDFHHKLLKLRGFQPQAQPEAPTPPPAQSPTPRKAHSHSHNHSHGPGPKLPVVVLTGYLGAGKTTLLNYVLNEQRDKKLAVIENEIGEVSVDDALVEQKHEEMAEELTVLNNGCICCTIRGDLQKTLQGLVERQEGGKVALDGVLIELTGAADPAPVVQTFFMDETVRRTFYVDNVIALVDAKHCLDKLDESKGDPKEKGTACAQIAFSSTVLLNKIDLVDEARILECETRLKEVNRAVDIIRCEQARVPLDKLFNVKAFDLAKVLEEQYMDEEEFHAFYKPKMDQSISNVGVKFGGAINMFAFQEFLDKLIGEEDGAKDFLRIKGVLNIKGEVRMFVLQCVHMVRNMNFTRPWAKSAERENRIIFIGRGMQQRRQELTDGVMACIVKPLRFNIGTKVQARMDETTYKRGTITRQWDQLRAYRIRLDNGDEVHAAMDDDSFVKAA